MNLSTLRLASLGLCLFILSTGCVSSWPKITLLEKRDSQIRALLQYFHHAKSLPPTELHNLYIQEEEVLFYQNDYDSILRLALLSTLQDTKLKTISRSIELLTQYLSENSPTGEKHHFAAFLLHHLSQTQHRELMHQLTQDKLNITTKERGDLAVQYQQAKMQLEQAGLEQRRQQIHYKKTNQALLKEQRTVANLRKQIEQLKTIEKTLNQRKKSTTPST